MYTDAHCHLAAERLAGELSTVLERSRSAGVTRWIQGGIDPADWDRQLELKKRFGSSIVTCYGLHPVWVAQNSRSEIENGLELLEKRLSEADAVGELGLDHRYKESHEFQEWAFRAQLTLAGSKPLILHVVRAHGQALEILREHAEHATTSYRGIIHRFSGSFEVAKQYLELGFFLSIGSNLDTPGYEQLRKTVKRCPADRLVFETDAPDGTAEPADLIAIVRSIAREIGHPTDELLEISSKNLETLFELRACAGLAKMR